ncbi:4-phosphoerythronate dehydrogenase [Seongchinamella unica]|uniref:Erythronate-4-phosphate dehydrogenase n=1 Tax=Seongchinamella unica TaxID=2547392 RepID=A0A4R5LSC8_9GAMM|nr:4-phosphoerythronate dehydrogenase [Seongchinamella unica]TDG13809.1 4-phosphoerythronate dehydrogenase [Seongchinamella unica]
MTLQLVADENIPGVEAMFGPGVAVQRVAGRRLTRASIAGADMLLVRSVTGVNAELLEGTPVKFVGTATSGTDHIDINYLREANIGFAHAPGSNANSVVEYVLGAIAALDDYLERLLAGASVGIVGYGNIGRALAARLRALGIRCLVNDPWLSATELGEAIELEAVLRCEVVCLHPELTREDPWPSFHLLGESELASLGRGQLLINASRGPVIDNAALYRRLQHSAGPDVVLDVWETEPFVPAALLDAVRLGTAHIAGYSYDGKLLATRMLRDAAGTCLGQRFIGAEASAGEAPTPLRVDHDVSLPQLLRKLLNDCYQIEEDDRQLRAAVAGADHEDCREHFDQLRKCYPQRRELAGRKVLLAGGSERWRDIVRALGCSPLEGD